MKNVLELFFLIDEIVLKNMIKKTKSFFSYGDESNIRISIRGDPHINIDIRIRKIAKKKNADEDV